MIRASRLKGIGLVDIDRAEKIGEVGEVFLDPEGRRVAGLGVRRGQSFLGGDEMSLLPASAIRAIGPDAITVGGPAVGASETRLAALPRLSQMVGRKVVTAGGRALGPIGDVLIDPENGRIVGYALEGGPGGALRNLFGGHGDEEPSYVRADADLRVGRDLVVVPDDALVSHHGFDDPVPSPAPSFESSFTERPAPVSDGGVSWVPAGATDEAWTPGRGTSAWIQPLEEGPMPIGQGVRPADPFDGPREVVYSPSVAEPTADLAPMAPTADLEPTERIRVERPRPGTGSERARSI